MPETQYSSEYGAEYNADYIVGPAVFRGSPMRIVTLCYLGLGLFALPVWLIVSKTTRLSISEREVYFETGVFSKIRIGIQRDDVRSIRVHQSLLQRLFNTGDVEIYSAGDAPEITLRGLPDPVAIRGLIG